MDLMFNIHGYWDATARTVQPGHLPNNVNKFVIKWERELEVFASSFNVQIFDPVAFYPLTLTLRLR